MSDELMDNMKMMGLVEAGEEPLETPGTPSFELVLFSVLAFFTSASIMPLAFLYEVGFEISVIGATALAAFASLGVTASIGAWLGQRWSVFLYTGTVAASTAFMLVMGQFNVVLLVITLAIVMLGWSQMRNLG
ncbi:MAG: hypothetical protein GYB68_12295 [Chloroflexi bacterium]|nr:hypothetical protein [Chloroflexota bacterium]